MSTNTTAGPSPAEGRPARVIALELAEHASWLAGLAGNVTITNYVGRARIELEDRPDDLPPPGLYDTELDEANASALAAYADVRARLVEAFGTDWHSRQLAASVVDNLAAELVADNTEPDDDEDPDSDL